MAEAAYLPSGEPRCRAPDFCDEAAIYGYEGEEPILCHFHRLDDMVCEGLAEPPPREDAGLNSEASSDNMEERMDSDGDCSSSEDSTFKSKSSKPGKHPRGHTDDVQKQCSVEGCTIIAHYGARGENASCCYKHKTADMVRRRTRRRERPLEPPEHTENVEEQCIVQGCTFIARYGRRAEEASCCVNHKVDKMVVKAKRRNEKPLGHTDDVEQQCVVEGCTIKAHYGARGEQATYCRKHKTGDMKQKQYPRGMQPRGHTDDIEKRCTIEACTIIARYNTRNIKVPSFCWKHKSTEMVEKNPLCEFHGCLAAPSFGIKEEGKRRFCGKHKQDGMISLLQHSRRCTFEGCTTDPSFGFLKEQKAVRCAKHKEEGMVIKSVWQNLKRLARTCSSDTAQEGEIVSADVLQMLSKDPQKPRRVCTFEGCMLNSSFGFLAERKSVRCGKHKEDGMVSKNMWHKKKSRRKGALPTSGASETASSEHIVLPQSQPPLCTSSSLIDKTEKEVVGSVSESVLESSKRKRSVEPATASESVSADSVEAEQMKEVTLPARRTRPRSQPSTVAGDVAGTVDKAPELSGMACSSAAIKPSRKRQRQQTIAMTGDMMNTKSAENAPSPYLDTAVDREEGMLEDKRLSARRSGGRRKEAGTDALFATVLDSGTRDVYLADSSGDSCSGGEEKVVDMKAAADVDSSCMHSKRHSSRSKHKQVPSTPPSSIKKSRRSPSQSNVSALSSEPSAGLRVKLRETPARKFGVPLGDREFQAYLLSQQIEYGKKPVTGHTVVPCSVDSAAALAVCGGLTSAASNNKTPSSSSSGDSDESDSSSSEEEKVQLKQPGVVYEGSARPCAAKYSAEESSSGESDSSSGEEAEQLSVKLHMEHPSTSSSESDMDSDEERQYIDALAALADGGTYTRTSASMAMESSRCMRIHLKHTNEAGVIDDVGSSDSDGEVSGSHPSTSRAFESVHVNVEAASREEKVDSSDSEEESEVVHVASLVDKIKPVEYSGLAQEAASATEALSDSDTSSTNASSGEEDQQSTSPHFAKTLECADATAFTLDKVPSTHMRSVSSENSSEESSSEEEQDIVSPAAATIVADKMDVDVDSSSSASDSSGESSDED